MKSFEEDTGMLGIDGPLKPEDVKLPLGWVGGGAPGGLGRASEGRPEGEEAEGQGACRTGTGGEDEPGVG